MSEANRLIFEAVVGGLSGMAAEVELPGTSKPWRPSDRQPTVTAENKTVRITYIYQTPCPWCSGTGRLE